MRCPWGGPTVSQESRKTGASHICKLQNGPPSIAPYHSISPFEHGRGDDHRITNKNSDVYGVQVWQRVLPGVDGRHLPSARYRGCCRGRPGAVGPVATAGSVPKHCECASAHTLHASSQLTSGPPANPCFQTISIHVHEGALQRTECFFQEHRFEHTHSHISAHVSLATLGIQKHNEKSHANEKNGHTQILEAFYESMRAREGSNSGCRRLPGGTCLFER